jgi:hypothetical protein
MTKLKKRIIIPFLLFLVLLGYVFGQILPVRSMEITIKQTPLTTHEILSLSVSLISILITFVAVTVALFKEDIRQFWENVELKVTFYQNRPFLEFTRAREFSSSLTKTPIAEKYETILVISNTGSLAAKNCKVYLDKLQIVKNGTNKLHDVNFDNSQALKWKDKTDAVLVPPNGKALINVLSVISPEAQSVGNLEEENGHENSAKLIVGDYTIPDSRQEEHWIATFMIYPENARSLEYKLSVEWNHEWHTREPEMTEHLIIKPQS